MVIGEVQEVDFDGFGGLAGNSFRERSRNVILMVLVVWLGSGTGRGPRC